MKIAVCFVAFVIGCVFANQCSDSIPCDTTVTTCANGFTLTCMDIGANDGNHCVCVDGNGGANQCTANADCHNTGHTCNHGGHFECVNGHCHCNAHHGGPGGNHGNGK